MTRKALIAVIQQFIFNHIWILKCLRRLFDHSTFSKRFETLFKSKWLLAAVTGTRKRGGISEGSPCIICVQYIGGCSVHRGVFSTSRGVQYIEGISWVHWGDIMSTSGMFSTSGDIMMNVGDTMSTWGMFSTLEGYHEYIGGISWVHRGMFSTSEGYHDTCGEATW